MALSPQILSASPCSDGSTPDRGKLCSTHVQCFKHFWQNPDENTWLWNKNPTRAFCESLQCTLMRQTSTVRILNVQVCLFQQNYEANKRAGSCCNSGREEQRFSSPKTETLGSLSESGGLSWSQTRVSSPVLLKTMRRLSLLIENSPELNKQTNPTSFCLLQDEQLPEVQRAINSLKKCRIFREWHLRHSSLWLNSSWELRNVASSRAEVWSPHRVLTSGV